MLKYNIKTGVSKIKTKTAIVLAAFTLGLSGLGMAVAVPALSHAAPSSCGVAHAASANVYGNYGWLGADGGTPGYHGAMGQESGATGYNNSHTDCQG